MPTKDFVKCSKCSGTDGFVVYNVQGRDVIEEHHCTTYGAGRQVCTSVEKKCHPTERSLFLSFSTLLYCLAVDRHPEVTQDDLNNGLFYFGACRELVVDAPEKEYAYQNIVKRVGQPAAAAILQRIVEAVLKAEAAGRAHWRTPGTSNSYEDVSALLLRNGYAPIAGNDGRQCNDAYCYPGVSDRLAEAGLPIRPVR